ncbi:MAG: GNAT family N-acetyltransferase [Paracoccaceae bacterium]
MTGAALIRRFRPEDAGATRTVFFKAVREGAADHYRTEQLIEWAPSPDMPDGWGEWLDRNFTVVAEHGGLVVGFFMLEPSGYLNMAFVLPAWRRTGLADRLYAAILAEARAQRMPRMTVWASRLACRFLARHGWVIDTDPPPRAGHPVPTDDAEPLDYPMKLDLVDPT